MLLSIDGTAVGVSVTRAFHWPPDEPYTTEEATALLDDKLTDVSLSTANAAASNPWTTAILHVIAYDPSYADRIEEAYALSPAETLSDTIVIVTVTDGNDDFIY